MNIQIKNLHFFQYIWILSEIWKPCAFIIYRIGNTNLLGSDIIILSEMK